LLRLLSPEISPIVFFFVRGKLEGEPTGPGRNPCIFAIDAEPRPEYRLSVLLNGDFPSHLSEPSQCGVQKQKELENEEAIDPGLDAGGCDSSRIRFGTGFKSVRGGRLADQ
jgi:hypothetical protein